MSNLELVSGIIKNQMYNGKEIQSEICVYDNQIEVTSNNSSHLQALLASVISIESVYLKTFDSNHFEINVH